MRYHTALTSDEQCDLGVTEPGVYAYADRVHTDDLDPLMHVNNVRSLVWFERARIRFLEHMGIGAIGDPNAPRVVIRSGQIHWIEEMLNGEDYIVTCAPRAFRKTSISVTQAIWSSGRKRTTFDCIVVLLNQNGESRIPIPEDIRARLVAAGAQPESA